MFTISRLFGNRTEQTKSDNDIQQGALISASDAAICAWLDQATATIEFVGAGFSEVVARKLIEKRELLGRISIDNSDFSFQTGYCSLPVLALFRDAGISLLQSQNLRINLLRVDDEVFVYSPAPLTLEEQPQSSCANGIVLPYAAVADIFEQNIVAKPDMAVETEPTEAEEEQPAGPVICTQPITAEESQATEEQLQGKIRAYNVSRQLNVYTSTIGFIELKLLGFSATRRVIKIPPEIFERLNRNQWVKGQLQASYRLFSGSRQHKKDDGMDGLFPDDAETQFEKRTAVFQEKLNAIKKEYLVEVPTIGVIYAKDDGPELEEKIRDLQAEIRTSRKELADLFKQETQPLIDELTDWIIELLKQTSPEGTYSLASLEQGVKYQMSKAQDDACRFLDDMELRVVYKELTESMLSDRRIYDAIGNHPRMKEKVEKTGIKVEEYALGSRR